MRQMSQRIASLEKRLSGPLSCHVCHGEIVLRVKLAGEPDPEGCPGCGKISKLVILHRGVPPEDGDLATPGDSA
jgi:hypothetical protein